MYEECDRDPFIRENDRDKMSIPVSGSLQFIQQVSLIKTELGSLGT